MFQLSAMKLFKGLLKNPDQVLSDIDEVLKTIRGKGLTPTEKKEFWDIISRYEKPDDE